MAIDFVPDINFGYSPDTNGCEAPENKNITCKYWLVFDQVPNNLAKQIDLYLDKKDTPLSGKFRYSTRNENNKITYFELMPTLKQYK